MGLGGTGNRTEDMLTGADQLPVLKQSFQMIFNIQNLLSHFAVLYVYV